MFRSLVEGARIGQVGDVAVILVEKRAVNILGEDAVSVRSNMPSAKY